MADLVITIDEVATLVVMASELNPNEYSDSGKAVIYKTKAFVEKGKKQSGPHTITVR